MPKTLTEKLGDLSQFVVGQLPVFEHRLNELQSDVKAIEERLRQLESEAAKRHTSAEEKLRQLEKSSDRSWQFWLAILAAGVAILIALLKK